MPFNNFLTYLLILASLSASAQNTLSEDSIKSRILVIKQVTENYPDSAKQLIVQLRKENPKLSLEIQADLYKTEGAAATYTRMLDTAIIKFQKSGDTYQKIIAAYIAQGDTLSKDYFETIKSKSNIINNTGAIAYYQGNYELAIKYFIEASEIQESLLDCPFEPIRKKSFEDLAMSTDNIGAIYSSLDQIEKSLEYRQKAHQMIGYRNDRTAMRVKLNLANMFIEKSINDSADFYVKQIVTLADPVSMASEYFAASSLLGKLYLDKDELDSAAKYLTKATPMVETTGVSLWSENHYQRLSEYHLRIDQYQKALDYLDKAYDTHLKTKTRGNLVTTYKLYAQIYRALAKKDADVKKYDLAVDYLNKYVSLNDSLIKAQRFKEFNELQSKYETEKKEAENNYLKTEASLKEQKISDQQKWILAIVILLFASFILLIFQIRARKLLAAQKQLIQEQKNKLSELDATKSRFFANLSHDLRTPITLIMGNLKIIGSEEGGYLSAQGELSRRKAYENSEKLLSLSDEIRDLTALEIGHIKLKYEKVAIQEYLNLLLSMFKSAAEIKGVSLSFESGDENDWVVHIDTKQFEKIIYNLLSNALKFTKKGDQIQLKVTNTDAKTFTVEVSDTGIGIKKDQLPYIFERYYQSPENDYRSVEGLGIGLSLVTELVNLHGGTITVASETEQGSTFTLTFPKHLEEPAEDFIIGISDFIQNKNDSFKDSLVASRSMLPAQNREKKDYSILIVEDHNEIREYIATFLLNSYNVFYAGNGVEALEILEKAKVDLVITDLMMPVMDGFEFIDIFQKKYSGLPIMVVSARTLSDDRQAILAKGVNEIIAKPFDETEFKTRVKNILTAKTQKEPLFITDKDVKKELQNEVLIKINHLLNERLQDTKISVQDISDLIFASERKTFRLIKELTGLTPLEYITDYRLQVAEEFLAKREFSSLTEIAKAVGFSSSTRFSKVYEQKFGYNPAEKLSK